MVVHELIEILKTMEPKSKVIFASSAIDSWELLSIYMDDSQKTTFIDIGPIDD